MATTYKYLDITGLGIYDGKIKAWVNKEIGDVKTSISDYATVKENAAAGKMASDAWVVFLGGSDISTPTPKLSELATKDSLTTGLAGKVDKVNGMGLSQNSYTNDEKAKLGGIAAGAQVNVIESVKVNGTALGVSGKAVNIDLSEYAKTAEVNNSIANVKVDVVNDTDNTYVKTAATVDAAGRVITLTLDESGLANKITSIENGKADKATTLAGYNIGDAYTKGEIDGKIDAINAAISGGTKFIGVIGSSAELTAAKPDNGDIFVAGAEFTHNGLTFKKDIEYILSGEDWYELGDSSANAQAIAGLEANKADKATTLAGYNIGDAYTKSEIDGIKGDLQTAINGKVSSVTGGNSTYVTVTAAKDANGAVTLTVEDTIANTFLAKDAASATYATITTTNALDERIEDLEAISHTHESISEADIAKLFE